MYNVKYNVLFRGTNQLAALAGMVLVLQINYVFLIVKGDQRDQSVCSRDPGSYYENTAPSTLDLHCPAQTVKR